MANKIADNGKPVKGIAGKGSAKGSAAAGPKTGPGQRLTPSGTPTEEKARETLPDILESVELPGLPPEEYTDEAVTVIQEQAPQPPLEEKAAAYRLTPAARKLAQKEAKQTAVILLTMLDGIVCMFYGPSASMNDFEREMMAPPLERMLMRLDIVSAEVLSKWSDPILFIMGVTAWISRITREKQEARPVEKPEKEPEPTAANPGKDNGRTTRPTPAGDILITEQLTAPKGIRDQIKGDRIE